MGINKHNKNNINQHQWQFLKDNREIMIIIKYKKLMIFGLQVEDPLKIFTIIFIKIKAK
jgi:hypothetical protein